MRRSGTGAPPVTMNRTLDRSTCGQASERARASSRSGLPKPTVTRWRSIACRIPTGLRSLGTTTVPPRNRTGNTFTPVPPTRKNGAMATVTSSLRKSAQLRKLLTFQVRLAWVSLTPLGDPVVPEVCGSRQISSMPAEPWMGSSEDAVTSASKSSAPLDQAPDGDPVLHRVRRRGGVGRRVLDQYSRLDVGKDRADAV